MTITITFASQNSSDLDAGRRPELKSDETCDAKVIVIEITSQLCLKPLKQVIGAATHSSAQTKHMHVASIFHACILQGETLLSIHSTNASRKDRHMACLRPAFSVSKPIYFTTAS